MHINWYSSTNQNEVLSLGLDLSEIVAEVDPKFLSVALDSHIGNQIFFLKYLQLFL